MNNWPLRRRLKSFSSEMIYTNVSNIWAAGRWFLTHLRKDLFWAFFGVCLLCRLDDIYPIAVFNTKGRIKSLYLPERTRDYRWVPSRETRPREHDDHSERSLYEEPSKYKRKSIAPNDQHKNSALYRRQQDRDRRSDKYGWNGSAKAKKTIDKNAWPRRRQLRSQLEGISRVWNISRTKTCIFILPISSSSSWCLLSTT